MTHCTERFRASSLGTGRLDAQSEEKLMPGKGVGRGGLSLFRTPVPVPFPKAVFSEVRRDSQ